MFPVDVSDPAQPQVRTDITMPGFPATTYLHPFGDGQLLGVVRTGDGFGAGSDEALELSMFDVTDPYAVSQSATLPTGQDDFMLLADPKSVLVDPQRGLVGFPTITLDAENPSYETTQWDYHVYHWTGSAFEPVSTTRLMTGVPTREKEWNAIDNGFTRGLTVGDSLYVVNGASVWVFDPPGGSASAQVTLD